MNWNTLHLIIMGTTVLAVACGQDDNNDNKNPGDTGGTNNIADMSTPDDMGNNPLPDMTVPPDDMEQPDDMSNPPDMTDPEEMGPDMMEGDMGAADMSEFTYNSFVPVMENVVYEDDPDLIYLKYTASDATTGLLFLEFYPQFGATIGPQTFTFTGQNYQDCGTCLLAFICDPGCNQTFLVQAGTLEVTAAGTGDGDAFAATLTDVEMIEVTLEPSTSMSTPVIGGDTWRIPTMNLSSTTALAP